MKRRYSSWTDIPCVKHFDGKKVDRIHVDYGEYEKKTTLVCGSDRLVFREPGKTIHNAWILALYREGQLSFMDLRHMVAKGFFNSPMDADDDERYPHLREFSRAQRAMVRQRFGHRCAGCGIPLGPRDGHIDHHMPKAMGHKLTAKNAVLLCVPCNMAKSDTLPSDFYDAARLEYVEGVLRDASD